MSDGKPDMVALMELVAKAIVDAPDEVTVEPFEENGQTVLELVVAEAGPGSRDRAQRPHGEKSPHDSSFGQPAHPQTLSSWR